MGDNRGPAGGASGRTSSNVTSAADHEEPPRRTEEVDEWESLNMTFLSSALAQLERESAVVRAQLTRNGIAIYQGDALSLDPYTVKVHGRETSVKAEKILVACGTRPAHSREIPFDNSRIVDTDHLHALGGLPKEIIVVGAGVVGLEYASFMAVWGADATLMDPRHNRGGSNRLYTNQLTCDQRSHLLRGTM